MRTRFIALFLLFLFFAPSVFAQESRARANAASTLPVVVESSSDIIPISVIAKKPLRELQTSYAASESIRVNQQEKYAQLKKRLLNASSSEQPLLAAQVSQQRQRVLLSALNTMILIYQRADLLVSRFDTGLLSMRSKYRSSNEAVSNFDARIQKLSADLSALKRKSSVISQGLSSISSSVEMSRDLIQMKHDLSEYLKDIASFSNDYRALAQDILSSA